MNKYFYFFVGFLCLFFIGLVPTFARDYAILNSSDKHSEIILSEDALIMSGSNSSSTWRSARANMSKSSWKWYWEVTQYNSSVSDYNAWVYWIWSSSATLSDRLWIDLYGWGWYNDGWSHLYWYNNYPISFRDLTYSWETIGFWLDMDAWTLTTYYSWTDIQMVSWLSGNMFPMFTVYWDWISLKANFWAEWTGSFVYTVPSGYIAWLYYDPPFCSASTPSCSGTTCTTNTGSAVSPDQSWVKDASSCGFTCLPSWFGSECLDFASPINWYFSTPVIVGSGAYNWTMTLNLSQSGHIDDYTGALIWDAFTVNSATPSGNTITFSLSATTWALNVACETYILVVPAWLIQWWDWISTNPQAMTWSFRVIDCPWSLSYTWTTFIAPSASGIYIPFINEQNGVRYIDFGGFSALIAIWIGLFFLVFLIWIFIFSPIYKKFKR